MFLGNDVNYIELYRSSGVVVFFFFFLLITNNAMLLRLGLQDHIKVVSAHIMTPASVEFSLQVILKIATRVQWSLDTKGSLFLWRSRRNATLSLGAHVHSFKCNFTLKALWVFQALRELNRCKIEGFFFFCKMNLVVITTMSVGIFLGAFQALSYSWIICESLET